MESVDADKVQLQEPQYDDRKEAVETKKEPQKKTEEKPRTIQLDNSMSLLPSNNEEMARVIAVVSKGGGFPKQFETFEQKVAAFNLATSLMGRRWQLALNNLAIIKEKLMMWGELPGALAQMTGELSYKKVYVIDKDYNEICTSNKNLDAEPFAGVCILKRKGENPITLGDEFTYTIKEAEHAGQYPAKKRDGSISHDSPWMKYTKIMLMRKAMGMAMKFKFPDALVGCEIAEYNHDIAPDLQDIREVGKSTADQINEAYAAEP